MPKPAEPAWKDEAPPSRRPFAAPTARKFSSQECALWGE